MGKGVLIFVMASSLSLSAMYLAGTESDIASAESEADYKEAVIARETAQSAYNIVSSKVRRDFDSYRGAYTDLEYGKATYDIGATETDDGSITIIAVGRYGNHEYEIIGSVTRNTQTVLDALTVMTPIADVSLDGAYSISGMDRGGLGPGPNVHGVLATNATAFEAFSDEGSRVTGKGGTPDVVQGDPYVEIPAIRAAIKAYNGPGAATETGDFTWDDGDSVGSAGSPVILRVIGNLRLRRDFSGYGALFVEGDLTMEDNAAWHGLVYVAGSESAIRLDESAAIDGAMIVDGVDSADEIEPEPLDDDDRGLLGGHFDVDVFDEPNSTREIYHEHKYDDKYDVKGVDVINSGCKRQGLCWDQVMGSVTSDVRITTINSSASSGTYEIKLGNTTYTGSSTETLNLTVDPRDLETFTYEFDALCSLAPSKPSDVQDDADYRNGALSIQVYSTGTGAKLLYELSIYHHWKESDGNNSCNKSAPAELETEWVSASGKNYSGQDTMCASEDDNDVYTDWTQRESKWGKRQRKTSKSEKSDNESKKSKKSKKGSKSDWASWDDQEWANSASWYGEVFWANNGECAKSNQNENVPANPMQFVMDGDASISYNGAALKRLKDMLQQFNMSDGTPTARRLIESSTNTLTKMTISNDGGEDVVKTDDRLLKDETILDARKLLGN
jgi:hypothetical protein